MRKLTAKQERFAQYVAEGLTASEAYRRVYSRRGNTNTTKKEARHVLGTKVVADYVEELKKENAAMLGLTRAEKRRIIAQTARDRDMDTENRLRAIRIDNLMTGDNKPIKVEGEITLGSILREIVPSRGLPSKDK